MTEAEREAILKDYDECFGFLDNIIERFAIPNTSIEKGTAVNWGHKIREYFFEQIQRAEERVRDEKILAVGGRGFGKTALHASWKDGYRKGIIRGAELSKQVIGKQHAIIDCQKVPVEARVCRYVFKKGLDEAVKEEISLKT